ncbi:cis-aconitate decarboxylase [Corythoichthys intestinalis]|uniref:cis-aconitate decarboxylase n=1 Tax=Corythoichthys intestinalis TaxID=161448 RepID=UPI0025A57CB9|nr:cis-aconitate decarboxylase [Corythoichthys intestinalis]XP_061799842.1 cis-aconitate decarboxylase-like [Nerophis lumbriciformis]
MLRKSVTESFGATIHALGAGHLTNGVIRRSKRMMLDTLGVGLLGSTTDVSSKALKYSQLFRSEEKSSVWGKAAITVPPHFAAFVNGVAVHSMDFDDTWYPATHPSGAVLAALLALAEVTPKRPTGAELLLAFNVGIEVQGRLLRFSREAINIPKRFHPPSVVGVMGSAAACAKLLALPSRQCANALAIAACSAGAPLANAATQTKPLHMGYAAQRGLEAARLARAGLEGNQSILDLEHGYGVYYQDYDPHAMTLPGVDGSAWVLEEQDVAFKRVPAHLGMHWVVDAALAARAKLPDGDDAVDQIERITLKVPPSKYIDCPFPATEHQARHSFQFNACSAILDAGVSVGSFDKSQRERPRLLKLLSKVVVHVPEDNPASFDEMYSEVVIETRAGERFSARCNTFYGHWRKPLQREDLVDKFMANASSVLSLEGAEGVLDAIDNMETEKDCTSLLSFLRMTAEEHNNDSLAWSQSQ